MFVVLEFGGISMATAFPSAAFTLTTEFGTVVSTITLPVTAPFGLLPIIEYGKDTIVSTVSPMNRTTPPSVGYII